MGAQGTESYGAVPWVYSIGLASMRSKLCEGALASKTQSHNRGTQHLRLKHVRARRKTNPNNQVKANISCLATWTGQAGLRNKTLHRVSRIFVCLEARTVCPWFCMVRPATQCDWITALYLKKRDRPWVDLKYTTCPGRGRVWIDFGMQVWTRLDPTSKDAAGDRL